MTTRCAAPFAIVAALLGARLLGAQSVQPVPATAAIRLSQIGFLPRAPKVAVVVGTEASSFAVVSAERGDTVLRGARGSPRRWALSGE
jgi:hypothetical protein